VLEPETLVIGATYDVEVVSNLTRSQLVQYAGASGDYNPIHTDEIYATEVAHYPSVFAHGMQTMGMTGRMLTDYVGDDRLLEYGGRFVSQVWPGDSLNACATVVAVITEASSPRVKLSVVTTNQNAEVVFEGYALARVDRL
jgi:acyl dehydratase